jgi:hypothetical protein
MARRPTSPRLRKGFQMAEWFHPLFRKAESEDELVLLYSRKTPLGRWKLLTPIKTFRFQPIKRKNKFLLRWRDGDIFPDRLFHSVFDGIIAVVNHRTGISEWDSSTHKAPDYLPKWRRHVSKVVIFNFLDLWMKKNPEGCLREMVNYFEHEDTHLIKRTRIGGFLEEMMVTGQIDRLPSDHMVPSELQRVVRLAKKFRVPIGMD